MPPVAFISTSEHLVSMLAALQDLPTSPPSLYIDLEGARLSRHGTIALLMLYVPPKDMVYLVDIHTLGALAFPTPATAATMTTAVASLSTALDTAEDVGDPTLTLKVLLESSTVPKVFFDVRNDSDALFSHYGIKLSCIHDIQLMQLAMTMRASRDYLAGLSKTIEYNAPRLFITSTQVRFSKTTKKAGIKFFAPEYGGSYKVFEERPLSEAIKYDCVQDVIYMPKLWRMYDRRMAEGGFWQVMALEGAARRVEESHQVGYQPNGAHKRLGCWSTVQIKEARARWEKGQRKDLCE